MYTIILKNILTTAEPFIIGEHRHHEQAGFAKLIAQKVADHIALDTFKAQVVLTEELEKPKPQKLFNILYTGGDLEINPITNRREFLHECGLPELMADRQGNSTCMLCGGNYELIPVLKK